MTRVLVTGAASGLGAALVNAFRARGDEVLATDRVAADSIDLVLDITSDDDWAAAVEAVRERWGGLDVLVNNAGTCFMSDFPHIPAEEFDRQMQVNFYSAFHCCQAAVPRMLRRDGVGVSELPSSGAAAERLGWTMSRFNRKLDNVCDKLDRMGVQGLRGGVGKLASNRRARLVEYAVSSQLVTRSDLSLLDDPALRSADDQD